jgi:hypothetical protein
MKRLLVLLPAVLLFLSFNDPQTESARLTELSKKLEGTYQLQIINSREAGEIPLQYMDTIVAKRLPLDTAYFIYPNKNQMRLMILPESVISQPGFKKLVRIIHVEK